MLNDNVEKAKEKLLIFICRMPDHKILSDIDDIVGALKLAIISAPPSTLKQHEDRST